MLVRGLRLLLVRSRGFLSHDLPRSCFSEACAARASGVCQHSLEDEATLGSVPAADAFGEALDLRHVNHVPRVEVVEG